jgi:hypothetical protein
VEPCLDEERKRGEKFQKMSEKSEIKIRTRKQKPETLNKETEKQ